ncbi:MAG: PAS domain S-box protein, partial [Chloroflexi bacterium]|nr:PAS domain S-box protein [Chloroflexota bacterium]
EGDFDQVLSDFNILGFEGLQVIETVHAKDPRIPVVIVTGTGSEEIAVEALKRGAADYVIKTPKHIRRLPQTIHTALEKKKLVEERTHAEQERDRLFNYSIDLLCIAGFDGYFKQLNPAWGRTLGWTNDELMSKPYMEFVHPDDRQATTQAAGSLVDGNLVYSFENRYRCRDGKYKWLSWNSYPLADEDLIFAVAHDVTNRKQSDLAEHAARIHAETLAAASHALTQSLELESVLDTLLEHLRRVVPYDGANIMLLENESHLRIRSARGYEKLGRLENIRAMAFDAHNTPNLWKVMQTKQSCVVNDTHTEPGWIFLEGVEHVRSWLGVPLIVNDHIIGMYSLDKAEPDYFTPKEIRLVESRAEESLRESDEKFSKAFHSNPAMLVLTTLDGKNVDVNQAYVDFLGYSREEILGKSVTDLQIVSMEERQKILELIQRAGGSLHNAEIAVQVRGGSLRHILLSADVISLGSVPHRLTTLLDITERKQAEESLRQAEKKYRNIFENTVEAIHQTTLDGKYIIANPATARILGYDSPEDLMININDLNAQFYVQAGRREEFKRLMETHDTISDFESEVYRKDGSKIWVSEKVHTVRDNVGTPLFYEGTSLDITERKRNEERIRQQLARLTALSLIDQAITATFELRITLDIFLEHVTTQLHVDAAAVLLHNPTMHTLEFKAGKGFHGTGMTKLNLRLGESYAGKAALERHMISVPDITKADPPFTRSHLIAGEGFIAFYAVPLIAKGQIKGVLEVFHRARLNPDQEWLDFLITLAGQAAIAIDNAELFNNLHRSNTELMRAYDATIEGWSRALDLR